MKSLPSSPHLTEFILYCISLAGCGAIITSLGPLIPYFGQSYNEPATYFSFLFLSRAGGYMLGSILTKLWSKFCTYHQVMFYSSIIMMGSLCACTFIESLPIQTIFIFMTGVMNAQLDIFINVSIIEREKDNDLDFWLQFSHGVFGVGGLIGPLLVFLFGFGSFASMAVIFLPSTPAYLCMESPEMKAKKQYSQKLLETSPQMVTSVEPVSINYIPTLTEIQLPGNRLTFAQRIFICLMFLLLVGEECIMGGWISTYAVMTGVSDKESATIFGSMFWIAMTLFRFLFSCVSGTPEKKLLYLMIGSVIVGISVLLMISFGEVLIAVWCSSILFGVLFSVRFPLLLALPKQFGFDLLPSENSDFMICASLGEGTLAVVTGYMMNFWGVNMLFYNLLGINLFLMISFFVLIYFLKKDSQIHQKLENSRKQTVRTQSEETH